MLTQTNAPNIPTYAKSNRIPRIKAIYLGNNHEVLEMVYDITHDSGKRQLLDLLLWAATKRICVQIAPSA